MILPKSLFDFAPAPNIVYLASKQGFKNYCEGCSELSKTEKVESRTFPIRVFCLAKKCVKPSKEA